MTEAAAQDRVTVCHPAEDQMLLDFLAAQRATALDIVAGLDEGAWHRPVVPSGWTPAGLVEHLSGVTGLSESWPARTPHRPLTQGGHQVP